MVSAEDIVDVLWESLKKPGPEKKIQGRGRKFFSEYEIKKMIKDNVLKVPASAIVSPLAQDWLALKGVKIVREG